jgi:drug/metabolite transporter (DMT)-like permease
VTSSDRYPAGVAAVAAGVMVWGGVAVAAKWVEGVDGLVLGFHRLWVGALVTTVVFLASGRRLRVALLRDCLPGGIAFAADIALFFSALKLTTVANATVVGALQPALLLVVIGPLFGERVSRSYLVWTALAIGGVAVVMSASSTSAAWSLSGDVLAVAALLAWTGYFVASKQARVRLDTLEYLTGMTIVAALALAPVALLAGGSLVVPSAADWVVIVLLAVASGGVGHFLMNWAHPYVPLSHVSLLTLGVPVVSTVVAAVLLDEPLLPIQALGMLVVVVALAVVVTRTPAAGGRTAGAGGSSPEQRDQSRQGPVSTTPSSGEASTARSSSTARA